MRYRQLGSSGLTVSVSGLGCNNFGRRLGLEDTRSVVHAALDAGVTLFDTADIYGESEALLGEVLAERRDEIVLATKFGMSMGGRIAPEHEARGSRRYIRRAVESSLRRLRTDYIDLYQMHQPDPRTPIAETLAALDELVTEGKVRYLGSSNFAGWQIADAEWIARTRGSTRFVSAQNEYSLLERAVEVEVVPACRAHGVGLLPFFPLAGGLLTGKYRRGAPAPAGTRLHGRVEGIGEAKFDIVEALEKYAESSGRSLLELAIGGLAAQPAVASVIAGATTPEQVRANVAAAEWEPTPPELAELDAIAGPGRSE
ncbi:MAG TPA: aldo/keto reductase [Mycobacteriales bacterium]|nr:aldo/keto reductase [Mycobacteriales bacterium]